MKNIRTFMYARMVVVIGLILMVCSCDSFVDVGLPSSQLTSPIVFEEPATANAAMTDIYAKLRDDGLLTGNGSGVNVALGAYADELDYYGITIGGTQFF